MTFDQLLLIYLCLGVLTSLAVRAFIPDLLEGHERLMDGPLVVAIIWPPFALGLVAIGVSRLVRR